MHKKLSIISLTGICLAFLFFAASALANQDVIRMEDKAYKTHTKGIVAFSHKKHHTEYGITCGECHHDDAGKPLTSLKDGDTVASCIECHSIPGRKPRGKKDEPPMSREDRLQYHAEALHYNCIECHKEYKKKNQSTSAPTSCKQCHQD